MRIIKFEVSTPPLRPDTFVSMAPHATHRQIAATVMRLDSAVDISRAARQRAVVAFAALVVLGALCSACDTSGGGAGVPPCPTGQSSSTWPGLCEPAGGCASVTDCASCGAHRGVAGQANSACGWCTTLGRCVVAYYSMDQQRARTGFRGPLYGPPPENYEACNGSGVLSVATTIETCNYDLCRLGGGGINRCNGVCVDFNRDLANCGSCGNACSAGQSCCLGEMGVSHCIDTTGDRMNCGACGNACRGGEDCVAGRCTPCTAGSCTTCPFGSTSCSGTCVNTATDVTNCGACGHTCPAGQMCLSGTCGCRNTCGAGCVDLSTDAQNCGGCGVACAPTQVCRGSSCIACTAVGSSGCSESMPCCSGQCTTYVDMAGRSYSFCCVRSGCTQDADCCPTATGGSSYCVEGGRCVGCDPGLTHCPSGCTDVTTDPMNCGRCGVACTSPAVCVMDGRGGSNCVVCSPPNAYCGNGICANVASDANNCGRCGNRCPAGQWCTGGTCAPPPPCVPTCGTRRCGNDLRCGVANFCGTCPAGQRCDPIAEACVSNTCTPNCAGRACGSNGCGGSCGACGSGQTCSASGACVAGSGGGSCPNYRPCVVEYPAPSLCAGYTALNNTCGAQATCRYTRRDGTGGCIYLLPGRHDCAIFNSVGGGTIACVPTGNLTCEAAIGCR